MAFDRVWHAGLLHKLKSYGILGQIFGLILCFLSNRRLLDGKSSQEYPVILEFIMAPFFFLHFSCYILMTFLIILSLILLLMILLSAHAWSGIWSVPTTRTGFWTWIWSMRHCGMEQEVACWFQCWKNSTGFIWPV